LKDNCKYEVVGGQKRWSPDGKILAFSIDANCDDFIIWLDFSDKSPQIVEVLKTGSNGVFTWSHTGVFIYLDEFGNIIKKNPGGKPEKVVYFRSSYSQRGGTDNFQVSKNNVVLYKTGPNRYGKQPNYSDIYLSSLDTSTHSAEKVVSAEYLGRVILSPNGRFALLQFNYFNRDGKESGESKIVDLTTGEMIVNLPMIKASAWSPDGNMLAFLEKTSPEKRKDDPSKVVWWNPHFYIYDLTTGQTKDYGYGVSDIFSWSPNGKHILYSMKYDHPSLGIYKPGIFIMSISDGKDIGRLSKISASDEPYISPSGKYIVWDVLNDDTFFVVENPYVKEMGF
jgi:dipeptidyl aminopeptidase/acylaminoacyl peptidase